MANTEETRIGLCDEACAEDQLGREKFAKAFAELAQQCQTPMTIGIYGTWGMGKTQFMKLVEKELLETEAQVVWFDPWLHQFDDNPALALAQALAAKIPNGEAKEEVKKIILTMAGAITGGIINKISGMSTVDIKHLASQYEEGRFLVREEREKLQEHFRKLVALAMDGKKRMVFFIDDLDRCMPDKALRLLEALKLYLNVKNCVYFLGVDHEVLEKGIELEYSGLDIGEAEYLDKIVQMPFHIPPVEPGCMDGFVKSLLSKELEECCEVLVEFLGNNPRSVKRFINTLTLNHLMARDILNEKNDDEPYDPRVLALILLIQLTNKSLYRRLVLKPEVLHSLGRPTEELSEEEAKEVEQEFSSQPELRTAMKFVALPRPARLEEYIYLAVVTGVSESSSKTPIGKWPERGFKKISSEEIERILMKHKEWVESGREQGQRADFSKCDLFRENLSESNLIEAKLRGANLRGANLIGADLRGADLSEANLRGADLRRADLREGTLSGANLRGAYFSEANLTGADLIGADFVGTYLLGADLKDSNITQKQLKQAVLDGSTVLPNGEHWSYGFK